MTRLFVGQNRYNLDHVDSTNSWASRLLLENPPADGTVLWSRSQSQGRGQRGNQWHSNPLQNLTFSVIFYPRFLAVSRQFALSQVVSLAIHDFLQHKVAEPIWIKWPNDILVDRRKIAGILLENSLKGNFLESLIAGIGLNVNQAEFLGLPHATSMKLESGVNFQLEEVLNDLCGHLEKRYLQLRAGDYAGIADAYHNVLFQKDQWSNYRVHGDVLHARIREVENSGRLLLERNNGGLVSCDLKEVEFFL